MLFCACRDLSPIRSKNAFATVVLHKTYLVIINDRTAATSTAHVMSNSLQLLSVMFA